MIPEERFKWGLPFAIAALEPITPPDYDQSHEYVEGYLDGKNAALTLAEQYKCPCCGYVPWRKYEIRQPRQESSTKNR